jgi:hypothetical protein
MAAATLSFTRKVGRVVYRTRLESERTFTGAGGSAPSPSAKIHLIGENTMESCLRCNVESAADKMAYCSKCGFHLCHGCEGVQRCACYEVRMTLHPEEARRYYALLDNANAGRVDGDEIEDELCELEAAMA